MLVLESTGQWHSTEEQMAWTCSLCGVRGPPVFWLCHGTSLRRRAPHQLRPDIEELGEDVPVNAKAALKDLQSLRAGSTKQSKDMTAAETEEAVLEDLLDDAEQ